MSFSCADISFHQSFIDRMFVEDIIKKQSVREGENTVQKVNNDYTDTCFEYMTDKPMVMFYIFFFVDFSNTLSPSNQFVCQKQKREKIINIDKR